MKLKQSAARAYAEWKGGSGSWIVFQNREADLDHASGRPVSTDILLNGGASRTDAAQVSTGRAAANLQVQPLTVATGVIQAPEQTGSYCGPATAYMILKVVGGATSHYDGLSLSQTNLAHNQYLKVDAYNNTPWALPAVMAPTLNLWMSGQSIYFYGATAAPSLSTYEADLVSDIDSNHPLAANIHETASGARHLSGYPTYKNIDHWQAVWAYDAGGATTVIADPAYSTAVSWGIAMGQPYRWLSSSTMTALVSGHGIVW